MNIVISSKTNSVYQDGVSLLNLSISFPQDVTALYWNGASGWIEFDNAPNQAIAKLPDWANAALNVFQNIQNPPVPVLTAAQALVKAQQTQLSAIGSACAAAITGGFQSSALGKAYTYPSTQTDQSNLNANVVSSLLPNLPSNWTTLQLCMDSKGNWAYLPHTATQIQQVGSDGKAAILACLTRNATLQAQVAAATSVAAVQAINF